MKTIDLNYSIDTGKTAVNEEGKEEKVFGKYSVKMNVPSDFDEAGQIYGKETFYQKGMGQIIIDGRRLCYTAKDNADAQEKINKWMPGVSMARAGGMTKKEMLDMLGDMSEDEILAMKEQIRKKREEG